jgi:hypothetical protein
MIYCAQINDRFATVMQTTSHLFLDVAARWWDEIFRSVSSYGINSRKPADVDRSAMVVSALINEPRTGLGDV